ncbi:MAG: YceI family protein [Bacteroidetes bacterium]|nr:MAG: YceI family protein [Bacteroidota bacterium]
MKPTLGILLLFLSSVNVLFAQKYFTREGTILFSSHAPLETIEARNSNAISIMDIETGRIEFSVLIKAFQFEKALMQAHFNENYMESDRFPKALFKGQIQNLSDLDLSRDGTYRAQINGELTIRDVTRPIKTEAVFTVQNGNISGQSEFSILVADYGIKIPKIVRDNVAKEVKINVRAPYRLFRRGS